LTEDGAKRQAAQVAQTAVRKAYSTIQSEDRRLSKAPVKDLSGPAGAGPLLAGAAVLNRAADALTAGQGDGATGRGSSSTRASGQGAADAEAAAESFALAAERLATTAAAAAHASSIRIPPPATPRQPSAREQIAAFAREHAIFFGEVDAFRSPAEAERALDRLAQLMRGNDIAVRVVGYTDERGGSERNSEVALLRAQKVADELGKRGVATSRLRLVGRPDGVELSSEVGAHSPNRRVQFELVFVGESATAP
jgi:outer membrane protein OmpA-like peptidoglycan-associated protein